MCGFIPATFARLLLRLAPILLWHEIGWLTFQGVLFVPRLKARHGRTAQNGVFLSRPDPNAFLFHRCKTNTKRRAKTRNKDRDRGATNKRNNSSPSSSSLSSPNETCYSFVRRAIQKLAGSRRVGVHRPWFLESWTSCTKDVSAKRYDPDGCECCDCENVQDLPIELRRVDDDEMPQRRQTFPSSQIFNDLFNTLKSRSMTNIKNSENNNNIVRSQSTAPRVAESLASSQSSSLNGNSNCNSKPKLVKQKKLFCDEKLENLNCDSKVFNTRLMINKGNVYKQRSLNEELMSVERLREKEMLKQNIQKQTSLNEELMYQRHNVTLDSFKETIFSSSTSKRFQQIKAGFTSKLKNTTTIEKVKGGSFKNGFVRILQSWASKELTSPTIPEGETPPRPDVITVTDETAEPAERRQSKEDGSDSSKDSSLQSDTSVDSEDSFASVIFVPKSDPMSPSLSPGPVSPRVGNSSVPNSPRIKQSSCPTSPRIKQMPLSVYPLTKQLSSPKPTTAGKFSDILSPTDGCAAKDRDQNQQSQSDRKKLIRSLAQKYSVQQIPKFKGNSVEKPKTIAESTDTKVTTNGSADASKEMRECLSEEPGFASRSKPARSNANANYPIVRHSSVTNGKVQSIAKPLPKLLSLELFNPETDDKDSDSSAVSSPDSVDSVVSAGDRSRARSGHATAASKFTFPDVDARSAPKTLLEAAADVAHSLDEAVEKVIKSSPRLKRREIHAGELVSVMQREYSTETVPLLRDEVEEGVSWNDECHRHLTNFADKLSEKLLKEIDQYRENSRRNASSLYAPTTMGHIDDPYIHRLSEELQDLSKLSAEIQKQNEYLAKLSASDKLFQTNCVRCKLSKCKCHDKFGERSCGGCRDAGAEERCSNDKPTEPGWKPARDKFGERKCSGCWDSVPEEGVPNDGDAELPSRAAAACKGSVKTGASVESCDSEKGGSPSSMLSRVTSASLQLGQSVESAESFSDRGSRCSDGGSTASLASCPDWKVIRGKLPNERSASEDKTDQPKPTGGKVRDQATLNPSLSDTSQESLPSDNVGGEITYHRYYHVFTEGELDQLIEKYVENLHVISSYYDHSSWCIVAEKVQVWTI